MIRGSINKTTGECEIIWNPFNGVRLPAPPCNGVPQHWLPCDCCGELQAVPVAVVAIMCEKCQLDAVEAVSTGSWDGVEARTEV